MMTQVFLNFNGVVVGKYDAIRMTAHHRADAEQSNQDLGFKGVAKDG